MAVLKRSARRARLRAKGRTRLPVSPPFKFA